jgi:hypothetical protein
VRAKRKRLAKMARRHRRAGGKSDTPFMAIRCAGAGSRPAGVC